ncbi:MAG TPA: DNA alkylation repair protein [Bacteroidia bacterium]|jgi:3-methyladenine DNA glycosylase AlkD|nr:DNA alkylation repair protein [Bacteroidia bacterium]
MTINKHLQEVENALNSFPGKSSSKEVAFLKKYIGTQYNILGLSVPSQRALFKRGYSFSSLKPMEQIDVWDSIWQQSKLHEGMTQTIIFWERNIEKVDAVKAWNHLKEYVVKIDNWAHSDGLSGFYSYLLEGKPKLVLPQLQKWNKSKNPWERRQSMVSLIHYHSKRNIFLPYKVMEPLVEKLLDDEDYFVQKGVGWALREIGHIYPKETFAFLKKYHVRITGVAFAAASEKLSAKEKEELKGLRKLARKKT